MAVYYPQAVVTMRVILEDFGESQDTSKQEVHRFTILCKDLEVSLNSYREADFFRATVDFKNFPFDPRAIRACGISIYMEDKKKIFRPNERTLDLLEPSAENIIFQGFVDTDHIMLEEESRTVSLEGRDFTSLLIDEEYLNQPPDLSQSVDKVIRDLLDQIDSTKYIQANPSEGIPYSKGIQIDNRAGDLPTLSKLNISLASKAGKKNNRKSKTYWDIIQNIVQEAGLIAYVELDKLIITKPRLLYNKDKAKILVYGANVKSMEFERKLGRRKNINIRVVALSLENKKIEDVHIPRDATEEWAKEIGIARADRMLPTIGTDGKAGKPKVAPFITFPVKLTDGLNARAHLVDVGQSLYEELGRQQIQGSLATNEMQLCDVGKNFFNATQFRIGTPIHLEIEQGDLKGIKQYRDALSKELTDADELTIRKKIEKFLKSRCYPDTVAKLMADTLGKTKYLFFTKAVTFQVNSERGFNMDIEFINFIELSENLAAKTGRKIEDV